MFQRGGAAGKNVPLVFEEKREEMSEYISVSDIVDENEINMDQDLRSVSQGYFNNPKGSVAESYNPYD
jgi:hypothetical protein